MPNHSPTPIRLKDVFSDVRLFLAIGGGTGLFPKAPGTFGTLPAIPLFYLADYFLTPAELIGCAILLCVVGIPICSYANQRIGTHDSGSIVWDEIAAFFMVLASIPLLLPTAQDHLNHLEHLWLWHLGAFGLFRFFDIYKPPPIRWIDKHCHGGTGVMADDVIAALFTIAVLLLVQQLI